MTKINTLELAQQGNAEAIASLMNRSLQPKGITVETILKDGCLEIWLKSNQLLDKQVLVTFLHKGLIKLGAKSIEEVKIYGKRISEDSPDWIEKFKLKEVKSLNLEATKLEIPDISYIETTKKEFYTDENNTPRNSTSVKQQRQNHEFFVTLRTFKFSSIVPYKDALSSKLYSSNTVRLLLFFGLFPLVARFIAITGGLEQIAWILGIYYCSIWGVVLYNLLKPTQFSWVNIFKCVLFTAFVGTPLLLFVQTVPPFSILYTAADEQDIILKVIGFVLGIGILEELCKALPVYLFLIYPGKLKDPFSSAFYGAMSGLGFAIAEGVSYSSRYAVALVTGQSNFGFYILNNTIRFISLPLNHAIWAGIVGYFLGLAAINPSRQAPIIFIGIAICAVLHGLYDTFSDSLIGLTIVAFSILLFVAYLNRSKQLVDDMQKAEADYISKSSSL